MLANIPIFDILLPKNSLSISAKILYNLFLLSQILFVLPLLCDLPLVGLLLVLGLLDLPVGHPHGVVAVAGLEGTGRVGGGLQLLGRVHRFGTWKKEFI